MTCFIAEYLREAKVLDPCRPEAYGAAWCSWFYLVELCE